MTRVMLVDDHPIVLSGLTALVESDDRLELVAAALVLQVGPPQSTPDEGALTR